MGRERGAANLERFNAERSQHLHPLIEHQLQLFRKRKLDFNTVGRLATYLADCLKIHRTTLIRNPRYRALLLKHLSLQPGVVSRTPDSTQDPAVLRAKLAAVQLELSNLQHELKVAKAKLSVASEVPTLETSSNPNVEFSNLAMLLVNVLSGLDGTIEIDFNSRSIVDLAARPSDRVMASANRASSFISWLEQNQALPMVGALVKKGIHHA